jgi:hypothetical protein
VRPDSDPHELRTKLRTEEICERPPNERVFCPFHDIARGRQLLDGSAGLLTEAFVADPRNDNHSIISQLCVVFHLLHNLVMGKLPAPPEPLKEEVAFRRFLCARLAVTAIYRHIIVHDVLERILDPNIYEAYMSEPALPLDLENGIPAEFTMGAFRFGHAMVRSSYRTNFGIVEPQNFLHALDFSAQGDAKKVNATWAIDWALFFGRDPNVNLSLRIGPFYSVKLKVDPKVEEQIQGNPASALQPTDRGLPSRDILRASYAGMWSVPALFEEIRKKLISAKLNPDRFLPTYAPAWPAALRCWLKDSGVTPQPVDLTDGCEATDIPRLQRDPPLNFFVLFEAAHDIDERLHPKVAETAPEPFLGRSVNLFPGQGGRHLGRFGSILVAESLFKALRTKPFGYDEFSTCLPDGLRSIAGGLIGDETAFDWLIRNGSAERPLSTMHDLLLAMNDLGGFKPDAGRTE